MGDHKSSLQAFSAAFDIDLKERKFKKALLYFEESCTPSLLVECLLKYQIGTALFLKFCVKRRESVDAF